MQTSAITRQLRISPRKLRLVADVVRNMKVEEALQRLRLLPKAATRPVIKLINSAAANAEHNFELVKDNLYIKEIRVDEAAPLKRWMPRAHGRATPILKRGSHLQLTLAEITDSGVKEGKKPKVEAPVKLADATKAPAEAAKPEQVSVKGKDVFDAETKDTSQEAVKEIKNVQREGRAGHGRLEGGRKGFASRIFRRKSGWRAISVN